MLVAGPRGRARAASDFSFFVCVLWEWDIFFYETLRPGHLNNLPRSGMLQFIFKINNEIDTNAHGHADVRAVAPTGRPSPQLELHRARETALRESSTCTSPSTSQFDVEGRAAPAS